MSKVLWDQLPETRSLVSFTCDARCDLVEAPHVAVLDGLVSEGAEVKCVAMQTQVVQQALDQVAPPFTTLDGGIERFFGDYGSWRADKIAHLLQFLWKTIPGCSDQF